MYQYKDRVSYSRVDSQGRMKIHAVVNALQDASLFHSEDVGLSCMDLKENAHAWLVNSWDIVFRRRPIMGEQFIVSTWPYKFRGVFGMRNFKMESESGEVLAFADSRWFYFDQSTGKPIAPVKEEVEPFGMGEPYPMEYRPRKVKYPKELVVEDTIFVRENHLDTNNHVNNGEYIRMVADYLPAEVQVEELLVEYRLAAKLGDEIRVGTGMENNCFYVVLMDKEDAPYVITCFQLAANEE